MPQEPTYEKLQARVLELEDIVLQLKKTEMMLNDEISWRNILIEESRDPIVILDDNAKVHSANTRFADMLGYSPEELSELHMWDWDALLDKEQILELARSIDATGHHFETRHRRKDGSILDVELSNNGAVYGGRKLILCICRDLSEKERADNQPKELIAKLRESLAETKTLRGILPVCSYCKKVRDDQGYWEQVDIYITQHSEADVTHSLCPECLEKYFPEEYKDVYPGES
jgi:PAS domain S-box-containing protein